MSTALAALRVPARDAWEPVLSVSGLNHYFGEGETRKQVLFDNDLEIMPGEIVIMTGPSGSGKTTLLTLVGGLRTVQEGSLRVLGYQMAGLGSRELVNVRREIGFIFQAHNLFSSLTAYQNVRMALQLHALGPQAAHERAVKVLEDVDLGHRLHYRPEKLSGGQKQRVAIARALVNRPRLVLADEPTAALDEKVGRQVVTLFQNLAREQRTTILIVTHDNRILDVADRIVNMEDGRIKSNVLVKESIEICLFLVKCEAFSRLTPGELAEVAEKMRMQTFQPGTVIFQRGAEGDLFYLIRRGSVDVILDDDQPAKALQAGDYFGEIALIEGRPRTATIRAREYVETYTLGKADFKAALEASTPFKDQLYKVYASRRH